MNANKAKQLVKQSNKTDQNLKRVLLKIENSARKGFDYLITTVDNKTAQKLRKLKYKVITDDTQETIKHIFWR